MTKKTKKISKEEFICKEFYTTEKIEKANTPCSDCGWLHSQHLDNESFEAYACEVAAVNIGRINALNDSLSVGTANWLTVKSTIDEIKRSLRDMRKAAEQGEYPGII